MCRQRTGPNPFGPPCGPLLRQLASPKREVGQKKKAAQRSCAVPLIYPPVSCRQVLDGSAACGPREGSRGFGCGTGRAFSRTRPVLAYPHGFIVGATGHRVASFGHFSLREKSDSLAGRRVKRLTRLAGAQQWPFRTAKHPSRALTSVLFRGERKKNKRHRDARATTYCGLLSANSLSTPAWVSG